MTCLATGSSMPPPGPKPWGPHAHENAEQLFVILKGEMLMKTDRGEARLKTGQAAFIYPGEVHENYNVADGITEYLVVTSRF
jgi:quercetin dioxygenase-like cupin family protein